MVLLLFELKTMISSIEAHVTGPYIMGHKKSEVHQNVKKNKSNGVYYS
jgi:hypothetical protein